MNSIAQAIHLIVSGDTQLVTIILLSLKVSGIALSLAVTVGLPAAACLALLQFRGRGLLISAVNAFMGLPPVVVGLLVYLLLSRSGPLGFTGLLYTPSAMVIAQTILAFPIVAALGHSAIISIDPIIRQTARTLGATPLQEGLTIIHEARYGIYSAIIAAFGRVTAEVGAILIVGGNIAGYTRVMTTTIALESDKGNFELALALGLILVSLSFLINLGLHAIQKRGAAVA